MATLVGQDQLNITTRMHSRGCIPPFTYSPQGCTYSFDWDDDGKAEVLTFVGNNLRVSHPDGSVPTRSYPWSYYKPNQPQQGLSYKIIPASLSGFRSWPSRQTEQPRRAVSPTLTTPITLHVA